MKRYQSIQCLVLLFAVLSLFSLPSYGGGRPKSNPSKKISPVLKQEVDFLVENPQFDDSIPVIVQVHLWSDHSLGSDLAGDN